MSNDAPKVMIIAGEASGDLHGAQLALALQERLANVQISGVGGVRMRQAGVNLLWDSSAWSAIGVAEAFKIAPRLLVTLRALKKYLASEPPDVLVLIDFGFFNLRVAKNLPDCVKVLYYFPPGSWRKNATCPELAEIVDRVVTPFSWSEAALRGNGFDVHYFGHPLLDVVHPRFSREDFCKRFGLDTERPIIGLLPGSRTQEIAHTLPALMVSCARLLKTFPELQFAVPLATSVSARAIQRELAEIPWVNVSDIEEVGESRAHIGAGGSLGIASRTRSLAAKEGLDLAGVDVQLALIPAGSYDVLAHSHAAVVTSGTATVEAAILGCPMVIIYRGTWLTSIEWKLRGKNIKFVGMPNIILDRQVCPELLQEAASPVAIAENMLKLISDSDDRASMLRGLAEVRSALGEPGAVSKTADVVMEMLDCGGVRC